MDKRIVIIDLSSTFNALSLPSYLQHAQVIFRPKRPFFASAWVQTLREADCVILANTNSTLNFADTCDIVLAMMLRRPIICLDLPRFGADTIRFINQTIMNKLNKLLVCDLTQFDETDAATMIVHTTKEPINYVLNKRVSAYLRSFVKHSYRQMN